MQKVKLGDAFYLQMGKTPARNNKDYWGGNIKWAAISDLGKDKYLHTTEECITEKAVIESGIKPVPSDTIIMSFKLSIGKVAITSEEVYTNEAIMAFIDKGIYDFDIDYLYYLFSGYNWTIGTNKAVKGLTLNKATLSEKVIALPPIEEQKVIAEKLDKVSSLIEKRKQQLSLLDTLVKSKFVEMFGLFPDNPRGWNIGTIKDVVSDVRYGSSRPAIKDGKYKYLRMNNITYDGELDLSDIKYIDVPDNELSKCAVRRGDVLFNRTNSKELVGKTCVYDQDEMMVLAGFVIRVRVNDQVLPEFLSAFLNTRYSKQMLLGMCKAAIGQANINAQEMQNIKLYIPPIEFQDRFVQLKNRTKKSKEKIKQSLATLELLKKSLMQKYFG